MLRLRPAEAHRLHFHSNSTAQGRWRKSEYKRELDFSEAVWRLFTGYQGSTSRPGWCERGLPLRENANVCECKPNYFNTPEQKLQGETIPNSASLKKLVLFAKGGQGPRGRGPAVGTAQAQ